jgi:hypothetical protein
MHVLNAIPHVGSACVPVEEIPAVILQRMRFDGSGRHR